MLYNPAMSSANVIGEISTQLEALDECVHMVQTFGDGPTRASGPHGRVLRDVERVLKAIHAKAAIVGGLAVIHHGYQRYTRDVDLVIAAAAVPEFLRVATVSGFRVAKKDRYGWHQLIHKETGMDLYLVPQGKPGKRAASEIPSPEQLGVRSGTLGFASLPRLIELKLLAGRLKDLADVVELVKSNRSQRTRIREHLARVHPRLAVEFDRLAARAQAESDEER